MYNNFKYQKISYEKLFLIAISIIFFILNFRLVHTTVNWGWDAQTLESSLSKNQFLWGPYFFHFLICYFLNDFFSTKKILFYLTWYSVFLSIPFYFYFVKEITFKYLNAPFVAYLSTIIFFLSFGVSFMSYQIELYQTFFLFFLISLYFLFNKQKFFFSGVFAGLALITHDLIILFAPLFLFLFFLVDKKSLIKNIFFFILGSLIILIPTFIFFIILTFKYAGTIKPFIELISHSGEATNHLSIFVTNPLNKLIEFFKITYSLNFSYSFGMNDWFGLNKDVIFCFYIISIFYLSIRKYLKFILLSHFTILPIWLLLSNPKLDALIYYVSFFPFILLFVSYSFEIIVVKVSSLFFNNLTTKYFFINYLNLIFKTFLYLFFILLSIYPSIFLQLKTFEQKYIWDRHEPLLSSFVWLNPFSLFKKEIFIWTYDNPMYNAHFVSDLNTKNIKRIYRCYMEDNSKFISGNHAIVLSKEDILKILEKNNIYSIVTLDDIKEYNSHFNNCNNIFDDKKIKMKPYEKKFTPEQIYSSLEQLLPKDDFTKSTFLKSLIETDGQNNDIYEIYLDKN